VLIIKLKVSLAYWFDATWHVSINQNYLRKSTIYILASSIKLLKGTFMKFSIRKLFLVSLFASLLALLLSSAQVFGQQSDGYILSPGDKIEIKVFGQDDLSLITLLGDSGKINYPFLNEIKISGLTVKQLEDLIIKGLKPKYLVNPNVYAQVIEYRPFYIHGEVNNPGGYPYQPGLTINQAIALAGGITERGSEDKIYIYKEYDKNKRLRATLSSEINAGDTITIDQSLF